VQRIEVDERVWRLSRIGVDRAVMIMVGPTRDRPDGSTPGSSTLLSAGPAPSTKAWLDAQPDGFVAGVDHAALDPFRGYATRPAPQPSGPHINLRLCLLSLAMGVLLSISSHHPSRLTKKRTT
jgi:hypothetical protein